MLTTDNDINKAILKLCEDLLPKTTMRNNQEIKNVLKMVKDHLNKKSTI